MHNFKKFALSVLGVVIVFALLSAVLIAPFLHSEMAYYQDGNVRDELAGSIDTLIIGSSNSLCGMNPTILDRELSCNSYNLSSTLMSMGSRDFLLRKEIARNPVKTVIVDLSYETLTRNENAEYAQGDCVTLARLSSFGERINFMFHHVRMDDWLNMYSRLSISGMEWWLSVLTGHEMHNVEARAKGFYERSSNDIMISAEDVKQSYKQNLLNTEFNESSVNQFVSQIEFCKQQGAQVILAVMPKSDRNIWRFEGQDTFLQKAQKLAQAMDCSLFDLNLLRNRYDLWSDYDSYYDETHLSGEGAEVLTEVFCDIIKKSKTEDVSQYFYKSYEEMKADSPYAKYLN